MRLEPATYQATASVGACMAGLAVSDGVAVLHGGAGCEVKLHTLLHRGDPSGAVHGRFVCTKIDEARLVLDPGETIVAAVRDAVARTGAGLAVVTAASFVEAAGIDHEHVRAELGRLVAAPAIYVVAPDYAGDLFEGYGRALAAIARRFAGGVGATAGRGGRVNLLGYLFDRPLGEHEGNGAELERLLAGVGLALNVVLLDGARASRLRALGDAELNVVLPGGEAAAEVLGAALGQPRVDAELPMGLGGTASWLAAVARATGRESRATVLIERESARVRALLRQAAEPLVGSRVALFADGAKLRGLLGLCRDLRLVPKLASALDGRTSRCADAAGPDVEWLEDLSLRAAHERLEAAAKRAELDLVVGTAHQAAIARRLGLPALEFGFPCHGYRPLVRSPYLGYEGVLLMATRILEAIATRP
jgi:nitrogenase molybdenum-iron protein alpha/beta subunit